MIIDLFPLQISKNVPNFKIAVLTYLVKYYFTVEKKTNFAQINQMENLHPETHQYYFERYLREKLSAEEKTEFELRLANDKELQLALETYKTNRKQFLKEIVLEQNNKPVKTPIINFIYLTITIIGIVLTLNFYFENKTLKEERKRDKNLITRLIEYIPFIDKKAPEEQGKNSSKASTKKGQVLNKDEQALNGTDEGLLDEEALIENPTLILDSVWVPVTRSYLNERLNYFLKEVDSTLTAQEILAMIYRNSAKGEHRFKNKPIGIKLWKTSENDSYVYDGHLLNLYLNDVALPITIVNDEGELVWLGTNAETILIADNESHLFE